HQYHLATRKFLHRKGGMSASRSKQTFSPVKLPASCQRPPNIVAVFCTKLTPKPKKAPARKQGQAMSELFLLVKYHPAVDQQ
ncbi:TPA: hypothetical protein ACH1JM_004961, partial [Klebsiella pneumoniae]